MCCLTPLTYSPCFTWHCWPTAHVSFYTVGLQVMFCLTMLTSSMPRYRVTLLTYTAHVLFHIVDLVRLPCFRVTLLTSESVFRLATCHFFRWRGRNNDFCCCRRRGIDPGTHRSALQRSMYWSTSYHNSSSSSSSSCACLQFTCIYELYIHSNMYMCMSDWAYI